jgi:hypothetical protein
MSASFGSGYPHNSNLDDFKQFFFFFELVPERSMKNIDAVEIDASKTSRTLIADYPVIFSVEF